MEYIFHFLAFMLLQLSHELDEEELTKQSEFEYPRDKSYLFIEHNVVSGILFRSEVEDV